MVLIQKNGITRLIADDRLSEYTEKGYSVVKPTKAGGDSDAKQIKKSAGNQ